MIVEKVLNERKVVVNKLNEFWKLVCGERYLVILRDFEPGKSIVISKNDNIVPVGYYSGDFGNGVWIDISCGLSGAVVVGDFNEILEVVGIGNKSGRSGASGGRRTSKRKVQARGSEKD